MRSYTEWPITGGTTGGDSTSENESKMWNKIVFEKIDSKFSCNFAMSRYVMYSTVDYCLWFRFVFTALRNQEYAIKQNINLQ